MGRLDPRVVDAVLALAAAASVLPNLSGGGDRWALVLVVAGAAPLVVRRRWPVPVFGWLVGCAGAVALWEPVAVPGAALLLALHTVASVRPRREALAAAAVLELGVVLTAVRLAGPRWVVPALLLTGLLVAVLLLGLYGAAHRAYVAQLHERARSLERERDQQVALAAAAERARIARELHDVVAHHLTVMVALSDGAVATAGTSPARSAEVMRGVSATGRRALAETRRVVGVLRDEAGPRHPVPGLAELPALVGQVRAAGLPTTLAVAGPVDEVPAGAQLAAYRLVQEALTNTLKHAGPAARAAVRVRARSGELQVEVDDDGAGGPAPVAGGGLVGMRERVRAHGGRLRCGPGPAGGWQVAATLRVDP